MFFRETRASFPGIILLTLVLAGCDREARGPERLAVVAFENLTSNLELDAEGRGAAGALVYDLAGAPNLYAETAPSRNGAYEMHASRVLEAYFSESGDRLDLAAIIDDAGSRQIKSIELAGPLSQGLLTLVNRLAERLDPRARSFEASAPEAFRAYSRALAASDPAAALEDLESATHADPKCAAAYIDWARLLLGQGERNQAEKLIQTAQAANPDPIDRARLEYLAASVTRNADRQTAALKELTQATPADSRVFQELAEIELRKRDYSAAALHYERAAQLNPDEPRGWNELGYVRAYSGDLAGARQALEHYRQLHPNGDANALDSLGEVSFFLGDFAEAEKRFLEADQRNHAEFGGADMVKAAEALLLSDRLEEADALFQKYAGGMRGAPQLRSAYQLAQWEFLTGRRKFAMQEMERILPGLDADARAAALCQLAIWKLQTGDSKTAAELSGRAADLAVSGRARSLSALCRAVVAPGPGASGGARMADAYGLLFAGRFSDATPLLESLYREAQPFEDAQIGTLLAWAYVETGRAAEAAKLTRTYPLPLSSGETTFASVIFPRYLFLRGTVLEQQGRRAEAKRSYQLYLKYAGDVPDTFGDQAAARRNLGGL